MFNATLFMAIIDDLVFIQLVAASKLVEKKCNE